MMTRLLLAIALTLGLGAIGLGLAHRPPAVLTADTGRALPAPADSPVLLPTVRVEASMGPDPVRLGQIVVRPTPGERSRALAERRAIPARTSAAIVITVAPPLVVQAASGIGRNPLDMPYYSFGTSTPSLSRK
jgi:hypothetical protein